MRSALALLLALLSLLLLVPPAQAVTIVPESDITLTTMDYHATEFAADPNNSKPPALWPDAKSATSVANHADVSMVAVADRAGVAKASVGVMLDWEASGIPFEQIEEIPIEVQLHFRYTLSAVWTQSTGSSNAGITIPGMLTTPWYSFYGHAEGDNNGSRSGSELVSFVTTPGELRAKTGDNLRVEVYAQGHGTNHPNTTTNSATASVTLYSVRIKWRPPQPDLATSALEVTQGIQDLNNSVALVARKRTFVRFHVQSLHNQSHPSDAILVVTRGGQSVQLRPIHPTRIVNVRAAPQRGQLLHAFLFEVPTSLTGPGQITLEARVNPGETMPTESSYANNRIATTVEFEEAPILNVIFYQVGYTHNGIMVSPPLSHVEAAESWIRRAYPTRTLRAWRRTFHIGTGLPEAVAVNQYLLTQQARDRTSATTVFADGTRYYGMVHDRAGFMRGLAVAVRPLAPGPIVLPYVASGPTGTPTGGLSWDNDVTYGDWYAGHELGHTYARRHPGHPQPAGSAARPACQAQERDDRHPDSGDHPGGYISTATDGPNALYGFDMLDFAIYPPRPWSDMMTYCTHIWISDFTYEGLLSYFQTSPVQSANMQQPSVDGDFLWLLGTIDPTSKATTLRPPFVIADAVDVSPPTSGDYAFVLRDEDGNELARHPFSPLVEHLEPDLMNLPSDEQQILIIAELIPALPQATRLEIFSDTLLLTAVDAGVSVPTVQVNAPNGGEIINGDVVTITWSATDADDDPQSYHVEYSADGGSTWTAIAQYVTGNSVTVSATNLMAGSNSLVRVWASDGLHTGSDLSDAPFTVANHLPEIAIMMPITGSTFVVSETVTFAATAYDADLGTLGEEELLWTSSLDGELGGGDTLSLATLSAGVHTIALTADDGAGAVISETVVVTVTASLALAAIVDELLVYPPEVEINAADPLPALILYVDNQNAQKTLTWEVSDDQPWITLDSALGATPGALTVNIGALPNPSVAMTATLTFSSPDLEEELSVPLRFTVGEAPADDEMRLLLPMIATEVEGE